jgi:meiosis arrest female protein 1
MTAFPEEKTISSCFLCGSCSKLQFTPIGIYYLVLKIFCYPKKSLFLSLPFFCSGIFWDIENIRLPNYYQAITVVEAIRQRFLTKYREAEFLVVCDVHKEKKELVTDLNNAQVLFPFGSLKLNVIDKK